MQVTHCSREVKTRGPPGAGAGMFLLGPETTCTASLGPAHGESFNRASTALDPIKYSTTCAWRNLVFLVGTFRLSQSVTFFCSFVIGSFGVIELGKAAWAFFIRLLAILNGDPAAKDRSVRFTFCGPCELVACWNLLLCTS